MNWKCLAVVAALFICLAGFQAVEHPEPASTPSGSAALEVNCLDCHIGPNPTKEDPRLAPCPRSATNSGPEVVLIDRLSEQYVPVIFAHKLHAQMAEIAGGCVVCHHFNPSRRILACQECHSAASPGNLAKPGLKGAYHRQCLNCHREWSHETECAVCHAKKTANSARVRLPDPADIMGILHPNAKEPITKVYATGYEPGKLVTFRHQDHVKRFGFKCVNCHREQNCSQCHTPAETAPRSKTFTEYHARCAACHETREHRTEACANCHSDTEIPPFSHEKTGFALDETHQDAACSDCHVSSQFSTKFSAKPTCSTCHEEQEKITYPERLPGAKVASL